MPQFLNSANFIFRSSTWLVRYYSNFKRRFLCFTVYYLFPVISRTRMLVGWSCILSLINTDCTIPGHFRARFSPRLFLTQPEGSGVQTIRRSRNQTRLNSGSVGKKKKRETRAGVRIEGKALISTLHLLHRDPASCGRLTEKLYMCFRWLLSSEELAWGGVRCNHARPPGVTIHLSPNQEAIRQGCATFH